MPRLIMSFIKSYLDATESNTPRTMSTFSSSRTVLKPKWVVPASESEGLVDLFSVLMSGP